MYVLIEQLSTHVEKEVVLKGWVTNRRNSKGLAFIILRDGSGFCQCVVDESLVGEEVFAEVSKLTQESAISLKGRVKADERQVGGFELQVSEFSLINLSEEYPISNKAHGVEFLMDNRHLWLRSKKQWEIMKIRNAAKHAINSYFQEKGFLQLDTPIFTGSAAEGSTTLFETEFYGEPAYLAQTGQLYGEAMAMAFGRIYTFGPTFRAEKSKTRRHLSEFWMIEPEMAFYNNEMNMDLIEDFLRTVVLNVIDQCGTELEILERDLEMLKKVEQVFPRIPYDQAVKILRGEEDVNGRNSLAMLEADLETVLEKIAAAQKDIEERQALIDKGGIKKGVRNFNINKIDTLKQEIKDLEEEAENIPKWMESARNFSQGADLGGSDETVLTKLFDAPVMVYNWPKAIKAFYMKEVDGQPDYVKGVDVLAPEGFGEIVGGSERESDTAVLTKAIEDHQLPMESFEWYMDLRRYGGVPHAGFGLGFERFVCWISGVRHVREVIPFPRMYGRLFP